MAPEKSATISVSGIIQETAEKMKQREQLVEEIAGSREILRYLAKAGQTTAEESAWINEAFPPRKAKDGEAEGNGGGE